MRLFLLSFLLIAPAMAQTPAERASRMLEQGQQQDRAAEAAQAAQDGAAPVVPPAQVLPLEADRRSLQPDVGRPETTGTRSTGGTGGDRPPSGSQNPQR